MEASRTAAARALGAVRSAGALSLLILVLGVVGGALLIATEFSTIYRVDVLTGTCQELADARVRDTCEGSGLEQHGGALLLLGGLGIAMAIGAGRGASRPAAVALMVLALIVIALTLLRDLPKTNEDGLIGVQYSNGQAMAGAGFYLEIAGAALCGVAGAIRALRPGPAED